MGRKYGQIAYRCPEWQTFRAEMLERDGFRCSRCERSQSSGVVLQVHHKAYVSGRRPWEYRYDECEVLCQGCHAETHGLVCPSIGWECFGDGDLGDLIGECELCATAIRYVFYLAHPDWEPMAVGTECCDNLTGTEYASNKIDSLTRFRKRQATFVNSPRWRVEFGEPTMVQKGVTLRIRSEDDHFRLTVNGVRGKVPHPSITAAKQAAFEFIESNKFAEFLGKLDESRKRRWGVYSGWQ